MASDALPAESFDCFLQQELSKLQAHITSEYRRHISLARRCQDTNCDGSASSSDSKFGNAEQAMACNAGAVDFAELKNTPPVSPLGKHRSTCRMPMSQSNLEFAKSEAAGGQSRDVVSLGQGEDLAPEATAAEAKVANTEADCGLPALPGSLGCADAICTESLEPNFLPGNGTMAKQGKISDSSMPTTGSSMSDTLAGVRGELLRITVVGASGLRKAQHATLGDCSPDPMCICEVSGRPGCGFQTRSLSETASPTWNHVAEIGGLAISDTLVFTVLDGESESTVLGRASIDGARFWQASFEGELVVQDSEDTASARLEIKLDFPSRETVSLPTSSMGLLPASSMGTTGDARQKSVCSQCTLTSQKIGGRLCHANEKGEHMATLAVPGRGELGKRNRAPSMMWNGAKECCSRELWNQTPEPNSRMASVDSDSSSQMDQHKFFVLPAWSNNRRNSLARMYTTTHCKTQLFDEMSQTNSAQHQGLDTILVKPGSMTNILWDLLGLLLVVWDCFIVPLAFLDPPKIFTYSSPLAWCGRLYWTLNIGTSCVTGYIDHTGTLVMSAKKITRRYAVTWLFFDAIMVCSDWLEVILDGGEGVQYHRIGMALRGVRMIRTVRLLRIVKAPLMSSQFISDFFSEELLLVAYIFKIMISLLGAAHFIGCLWYALGHMDSNGWVHKIEQIGQDDLWSKYIWALHSTLSMFLGDTLVEPERLIERCFSLATLFFGFIVSSSLVSSLTTAMTRLQMLCNQQSAQLSQLRRFLSNKGISRALAWRVQRNAQHILSEQKQNMPEHTVTLFNLISEPLKAEIHLEVYSEVLMAHQFFCCLRDINLACMRKVCHTCVSVVSLSVGDVLFSELEVPTQPRMFFMKSGRTKYQNMCFEEVVQRLQWLCEPVLWTTWTHCGTLQAVTESTLIAVDAEKFQSACSGGMVTNLTRYAQVFVAHLNQMEEGCLTDIGEIQPVDNASAFAFPELFVDSDEEQGELKASHSGSLISNRPFGSHRASYRRSNRVKGRGTVRERATQFCRALCKWCWPTDGRAGRVDNQIPHPDNVEPFSVSPIKLRRPR